MIFNDFNNHNEYVLYVGRFQPPHLGHIEIFNESLLKNKPICIAIRNTATSEQNPLEPQIVKMLWEKIYKDNPLVIVIIIPNISGIKYGRNVGYEVEEIKVSPQIGNISATSIRNCIKNGDETWKNSVHELIHSDLIKLFK